MSALPPKAAIRSAGLVVELASSKFVQRPADLEQEVSQRLPVRYGLGGVFPVPIHAIALALGRTAASAMGAVHRCRIPSRFTAGQSSRSAAAPSLACLAGSRTASGLKRR